MVVMHLISASAPNGSYVVANKKDASKSYNKVKVLPVGSDEFLELGLSEPLAAGTYDFKISKRVYERDGKSMHFFDALEHRPSK